MAKYLEVKTIDHIRVYLRKSQVSAVEHIPATNRIEEHLRVYIPGYSYNILFDLEEFMKLLEED